MFMDGTKLTIIQGIEYDIAMCKRYEKKKKNLRKLRYERKLNRLNQLLESEKQNDRH